MNCTILATFLQFHNEELKKMNKIIIDKVNELHRELKFSK